MDILLSKHFVYYNKYDDSYVFYINDIPLKKEEIHTSFCSIEFFIHNNYMFINYLKTNKEYRNNGFATFLILYVVNFFSNINVIELDDFTEFYGQKNNIYIKMGFEYITKDEPEMIGYNNIIKKYINTFKNRYKYNNYYKIKMDY